jgi:hypothetical protein
VRLTEQVRTLLVVGFGVFALSSSPAQSPSGNSEYYHPSHRVANIPEIAADAKVHGQRSIRIAPPIIEYLPMPSDMSQVITQAALAFVQVEKSTPRFQDKYQTEIVSDVSFKVIRYISGQSTIDRRAGNLPSPPQNLTVTLPGGILAHDEVEVTQPSHYPPFVPGDMYMVFLSAEQVDGTVAFTLPFGPNSLVGVNPDGALQPSEWLKPTSPLRRFLDDGGISSVAQLSAAVRALR